jgi:hypothetical protein
MTEGPDKLLEGWRWVRLEEVCEVLMGQSPPSSTYKQFGATLFSREGRLWQIAPRSACLVHETDESGTGALGAGNLGKGVSRRVGDGIHWSDR